MKKTLSVNLGGLIYQIDEDGFNLLDEYLNNIRLHFRKEQGVDEIMADMESRISDLFSEKLSPQKKVIVIADVKEVITRLGNPDQIAGEEEEENAKQSTSSTGSRNRQLYRDTDNKMIGGVAAGLAAWIDCDATWVRLIMVLFLIVPYTPILLVYIIAWIVIPPARTAAEKLNMHGEDVTIDNIGKTVTDGFNKVQQKANDYIDSGKPRSVIMKISDTIVAVVAFLLKALLVLVLIVCCPIIFVLSICLILLIVYAGLIAFGGSIEMFNLSWGPLQHFSPLLNISTSISAVFLVGIPLTAFAFVILRQFLHWHPMSNALKISLTIIWIISIIVFCISLSYIWAVYPLTL
jgi:phage shock protein PspC (stress-responsive transcriptional regulator)